MGLTNFPNGIMATPNIGAGRLADIWAADNLFFVDGVSGDNANEGKRPDGAKKTVSGAISAATKDAVIYVKPNTTTASAQTYYRDNITVPLTKPNLSIIGCGAGGSNPNSYTGVQLKVSAAVTTGHLIDVQGAGLYLENMRLTGNSMTGTGAIVHANASATLAPGGLHIRGCLFEAAVQEASLGADPTGGSITFGTCNYTLIENNWFYNTLTGVGGIANYGTMGRINILNNIFSGAPAARGVDIHLYPGSSTYGSGVVIAGNIFADGLPTGGTINRFIKVVTTGTGIIANNFFASTATSGATGWGAAGTEITVPVTFFFSGNYAADGHVAAA